MLLPVLEVAAIMILEIAQAVKVLHQRHISSIVIDKVPCNVMPSDKELIISRPCQLELAIKGGILEDQIFLKQTAIETPMSPGRGSHVTDGKPDILIRPC